MNKLKKTLLLFILMLSTSISAVFAQMNNTTQNGEEELLIPTEGNWPNMPANPPICYNLFAPDYEFGFGISLNTAGFFEPGQPPLYTTFTVEFDNLPPYVEHVEITNDSLSYVGMFKGYPIYGAYTTYFESFTAVCPVNFEICSYTFELTTIFMGNHVPYPVENYRHIGQMFPAAIFSPDHFVENGIKYFCCEETKTLVSQGGNIEQPYAVQQTTVSDNISIEINEGTLETLKENAIRVYPNPFDNLLTIEFVQPQDDVVKFEVLDCTGRLISTENGNFKQGPQTHQLGLGDLPDGLYFIRTSFGSIVHVEKILKSK